MIIMIAYLNKFMPMALLAEFRAPSHAINVTAPTQPKNISAKRRKIVSLANLNNRAPIQFGHSKIGKNTRARHKDNTTNAS